MTRIRLRSLVCALLFSCSLTGANARADMPSLMVALDLGAAAAVVAGCAWFLSTMRSAEENALDASVSGAASAQQIIIEQIKAITSPTDTVELVVKEIDDESDRLLSVEVVGSTHAEKLVMNIGEEMSISITGQDQNAKSLLMKKAQEFIEQNHKGKFSLNFEFAGEQTTLLISGSATAQEFLQLNLSLLKALGQSSFN